MKKIISYAIFIFVITLIQTNLIGNIAVFGVKPNLFIVFIIVVGLTTGIETGAVVGFIVGLIMDSYSPTPVGIYTLLGLLLGLLSGVSNRNFFRDNYILTIAFAFIYTLLFETVAYFVFISGLFWADGVVSVLYNLLMSYKNIILIEALYSIPFAVIIHLLSFKFLVGLDKEGRRLRYRRGY